MPRSMMGTVGVSILEVITGGLGVWTIIVCSEL